MGYKVLIPYDLNDLDGKKVMLETNEVLFVREKDDPSLIEVVFYAGVSLELKNYRVEDLYTIVEEGKPVIPIRLGELVDCVQKVVGSPVAIDEEACRIIVSTPFDMNELKSVLSAMYYPANVNTEDGSAWIPYYSLKKIIDVNKIIW